VTKVIADSRIGPLSFDYSKEKYPMAYVIAEPCIGTKDMACVDACPVDAIHPGKHDRGVETAPQLYINADCIDCGNCIPACPVSAIFAGEDLPDKWKHYAQINRDWYADRTK